MIGTIPDYSLLLDTSIAQKCMRLCSKASYGIELKCHVLGTEKWDEMSFRFVVVAAPRWIRVSSIPLGIVFLK